MEVIEIILLIFGAAVFVGSFLIPARAGEQSEDAGKISEEVIREMVGKEVDDAKSRMNDIVDETINYAMEKTERTMDRLTNEKMMAINEYSDTVLEEINKNHKEVVFLYDMLNDKHENLKSTVSEAVKTASQVKQTVQDAEITVKEAIEQVKVAEEPEVLETAVQQEPEPIPVAVPDSFMPFAPQQVETVKLTVEEPAVETAPAQEAPKKSGRKTRSTKSEPAEKKSMPKAVLDGEVPEVTVSLNGAGRNGSRNSNERILELHKAGKSNMAIAKELGLGIGEVKLVIDLFEGV